MNTDNKRQAAIPAANVASSSTAAQSRHGYRERDFGIGYGNSSGYGADKRYTSDWGRPHFRFR
jgi:hypothetical protein